MHFGFVFLAVVFAVDVGSIPAPSNRTFVSPHTMHHPHGHGGHQHNPSPGHVPAPMQPGHALVANDGNSLTVLICRAVKIPLAALSSKQESVPVTSKPPASMAASVIGSSQQVLRNITTRVRTAVDRLIDPLVVALQNASLWLNRTSQVQVSSPHNHTPHPRQHQVNVDNAQQQVNVDHVPANTQTQTGQRIWIRPVHHSQLLRVIPEGDFPFEAISVPVLVPAADFGSGFQLNLTADVSVSSGQAAEGMAAVLSTGPSVATTLPATANDLSGRTFALPTTLTTQAPDSTPSITLPASAPAAPAVTLVAVSDLAINVSTPEPTAPEPSALEPKLLFTDAPKSAATTGLFHSRDRLLS